MKYIITKDNDVIIFSDGISHRDMAYNLGYNSAEWNDWYYKKHIVGAGFVRFDVDVNDDGCVDVECFGRSVSLGIGSRGDIDASMIKQVNRGY